MPNVAHYRLQHAEHDRERVGRTPRARRAAVFDPCDRGLGTETATTARQRARVPGEAVHDGQAPGRDSRLSCDLLQRQRTWRIAPLDEAHMKLSQFITEASERIIA